MGYIVSLMFFYIDVFGFKQQRNIDIPLNQETKYKVTQFN